jgi:hypothetical protein
MSSSITTTMFGFVDPDGDGTRAVRPCGCAAGDGDRTAGPPAVDGEAGHATSTPAVEAASTRRPATRTVRARVIPIPVRGTLHENTVEQPFGPEC